MQTAVHFREMEVELMQSEWSLVTVTLEVITFCKYELIKRDRWTGRSSRNDYSTL